MSKERFDFICDDESCRFTDNGKTMDCIQVVDKLNELDKQKESYKSRIVDLLNEDTEIKFYKIVEDKDIKVNILTRHGNINLKRVEKELEKIIGLECKYMFYHHYIDGNYVDFEF